MPNLRESLGDDRDIGVGAFWCGGADLLVGTASTGIALAGFLRLGTRAVFCKNRWYQYPVSEASSPQRVNVPGSGATRLGAGLAGAKDASSFGSST